MHFFRKIIVKKDCEQKYKEFLMQKEQDQHSSSIMSFGKLMKNLRTLCKKFKRDYTTPLKNHYLIIFGSGKLNLKHTCVALQLYPITKLSLMFILLVHP